MKNKKYKLIIFFGKAGAGKDFLLQKVYSKRQNVLNLIVSNTTRPPRYGEIEGKDYHFMSKSEFFTKEYIEYSIFNNWYYGTPLSSLDENKINIGVLNPDGIRQIYEREDLEIYLFYISAPEKIRVLRQLNREPYPNVTEICRRFLADEEQFKNLNKYPYRILRNSLDSDKEQCSDIIIELVDELKTDFDKMS